MGNQVPEDRSAPSLLRGALALVHDAVDATTELVREGHESTFRATDRITERVSDEVPGVREPVMAVNQIVRAGSLGTLTLVKFVNRAVEGVISAGLDLADVNSGPRTAAIPMRSDVVRSSAWLGDAAIGAVNGAVGDHLSTRNNGLDLNTRFRIDDTYLQLDSPDWGAALVNPSSQVVVFVHGLGTTEWSWCLSAEAYHGDPRACFGSLLETDLGVTPVYVRYNTGRSISDSGKDLAAQLQRFVSGYPIPIERLTLVGHSMGGLVCRSACHYALSEDALSEDALPEDALPEDANWIALLRQVFCLGAPHQGAPLAKLGHVVGRTLSAVDLPATRVVGRIVEGRSRGVKDLRHGSLLDEDWLDPALPRAEVLQPKVPHYFISSTLTDDPNSSVGRFFGDILVRVPSASGAELNSRRFVIETEPYGGILHHQIQNHPNIYRLLRDVLSGA